MRVISLTLDLSNGTDKDILLSLLITNALYDVINDSLDEFSLLALLGLLFETDPAVENGLDLRGKSDLLLLDEGLVLKTSSLLKMDLDV